MVRIKPIDPSTATGRTAELLNAVKKQLGAVPNIFKGFAQSPAVLESYLAQNKALAGGKLRPKLREQIAVAIAGANQCNYCASAHTLLGKNAGVQEDELAANLKGQSEDNRTQAALSFVREIVESRGHIADTDLQAVRDAGFSEAEIVEMIAHVGLNIFTNYFNHIAGTEVDFPLVNAEKLASAA